MNCVHCQAIELALKQCINRLRNQGGDISEITHSINMEVVKEGEAALKMSHDHPVPESAAYEIKRLEGEIRKYQLACQTVDSCCGCLDYGEHKDLDRGEPAPKKDEDL